jgi:hypothetical protein
MNPSANPPQLDSPGAAGQRMPLRTPTKTDPSPRASTSVPIRASTPTIQASGWSASTARSPRIASGLSKSRRPPANNNPIGLPANGARWRQNVLTRAGPSIVPAVGTKGTIPGSETVANSEVSDLSAAQSPPWTYSDGVSTAEARELARNPVPHVSRSVANSVPPLSMAVGCRGVAVRLRHPAQSAIRGASWPRSRSPRITCWAVADRTRVGARCRSAYGATMGSVSSSL